MTITNANRCTQTQAVTVTVNALPVITFTAQPGASACANTDVTYTIQASQSNNIWVVPGTLVTDYSITSWSLGTSSNTVTLKWLTTGSKTVTINYTNASGCIVTSATSSIATTVNPTPTLTSASQAAMVCIGSSATINLAGLLPSSTSTVNYN